LCALAFIVARENASGKHEVVSFTFSQNLQYCSMLIFLFIGAIDQISFGISSDCRNSSSKAGMSHLGLYTLANAQLIAAAVPFPPNSWCSGYR
jgi:hypothetical protein